MTDPSDIERLHEKHPGWLIGTVWVSAGSGPDARRLYATRDGIQVHAWTAAELSERIEDEENTQAEFLACDVLEARPEHVFTVRRVLRALRSGRMSPRVALAQLRGVL